MVAYQKVPNYLIFIKYCFKMPAHFSNGKKLHIQLTFCFFQYANSTCIQNNMFRVCIIACTWHKGKISFVDHLCYFCLVFVMLSHASVYHLLGMGLSVMFKCIFVTLPCGILCQVWYLIDSIPNLCSPSYFSNDIKHDWVC